MSTKAIKKHKGKENATGNNKLGFVLMSVFFFFFNHRHLGRFLLLVFLLLLLLLLLFFIIIIIVNVIMKEIIAPSCRMVKVLLY